MNESNDDAIIKKPLLQEGDSIIKEFRRLSIARQRATNGDDNTAF